MGNSKMFQEAQSLLSKSQSFKSTLDFIPVELEEKYQSSDLEYKYCTIKFLEMQAAKRDTIPIPTMKIWFIEFIRLGWGKVKFDQQYEALMSADILGYAIRIDHWINAVKPFVQSYEPYKPLPEQRQKSKRGLLGLREYIDKLDEKQKKKRSFYIDRKTKKKVYYPELPPNWKADLTGKWRRGDRIKTELRSIK